MFFEDEDLQKTPKANRRPTNLVALNYPKVERKIVGLIDFMNYPQGSAVACDIEVFRNFLFIGFKHFETNTYFYFMATPEQGINLLWLRWTMFHFKLITFNGIRYDIRILERILKGASIQEVKELSDAIILYDERDEYNFLAPQYNHIDLIEVTPLGGSLKLYGARIHSPRIQELPINPHADITPEMSADICEYNFNDLDVTELLYFELLPQIVMREAIGADIGEDLRSKSDAQIAERKIAAEYKKLTGSRPKRPKEIDTSPRSYTPPYYLQFKTPLLQNALATVCAARFPIGAAGYADIPDNIKALRFSIGNQVYQMSGGGLHSSETCTTLRADEEYAISDFDVASYYPKIILNGGKYPPSMGPIFLDIYRAIVERRLNSKELGKIAKKNGLKEDAIKYAVEADGLKITVNGTFGKLGNMYSIMFSPELLLYVTLTGQLTLLLLIEAAALEGFYVVNANTDGVVFRYPREREAELNRIVKMWEQQTSLEMEKTSYVGYFSRDVNNYMTLKEDGEWKTKGAYCERGSAQNSVLSRNPEAFICVDAVKSFIRDSVPIETTIRGSRDIRRFVTIRNVRGGAHKAGVYLGKVVRWYYAEGVNDAIYTCLHGSQVAKTEGAKPLMQLGEWPADMNYQWYINEAFDILRDIGYYGSNEQRRLF